MDGRSLVLVSCVCLVASGLHVVELNQKGIEAGKRQYEALLQKSEIPDYGLCWTSALEALDRGCKYLDDTVQIRLALQFASCFLEASGQRPIRCAAADDVTQCIDVLSDRQFDSYREFFTHTHNMCSFLQVQVWHRETSRVVSRLGTEAASVAERMERSGAVQQDILLAQQRALDNQQQLISHGQRISRDVDRWRDSMHDMVQQFREQTDQHRDLILTVFDRLTSLQQLVLDRFSWFNSLAHYLAGVMLVYLLTATARTAAARLWLFLILSANLAVERLLAGYLLSSAPADSRDAHETAASLEASVWLLRRAAVSVCLLVLCVTVYRYQDLNSANNKLLLELHRQHLQLRNCLAAQGMAMGGVSEPDWSAGVISKLADTTLPGTPVSSAPVHGDAGRHQCTATERGDGPEVTRGRGHYRRRPAPEEDTVDTATATPDDSASGCESSCSWSSVATGLSSLLKPRRSESPAPVLIQQRTCRELVPQRLSPAPHLPDSPVPGAVRSSPVSDISGSNATQPVMSGRYNLRSRPSPGRTPPLQSPVSVSRAARRIQLFTEQQRRLMRRDLPPS